MIIAKLLEGNLYFVKNDFFRIMNDNNLMLNHGEKSNRPLYLAIKDKNIIWLIPLSSKVDKYKKIINNRKRKYGKCDSIIIEKILGKESAILIQNTFPCYKVFIDHCYITNNGKKAHIPSRTQKRIKTKLEILFSLKKKGINLFMSNVDLIIEKLKKSETLQLV